MSVFHQNDQVKLLEGDVREQLRTLDAESVQCVVTSPPYWQLRSYGGDGEIGAERAPSDYGDALVSVFREVRRAMFPAGNLWLNLGDSYAAAGKGGGGIARERRSWDGIVERKGFRMPPAGYKMKDLSLAPFLVADALRRDGWYLRSTIIWSKPVAGEPPRLDRPSVSHEYLFLLTLSKHYEVRIPDQAPWWYRSVWEIAPEAGVRGHPATMPVEIARRCILAGSKPGDMVLDPFVGSGTTAMVARDLGRRAIGIDLSPEYLAMAVERIGGQLSLVEASA